MGKILRSLWKIITAPFRFIAWIFRTIAGWFKNIGGDIHSLLTEDPEDEPLPETFAKTVENPSAILDHLNALRKHLTRSVLALILAVSFAFVFARQIIDILAQPVGGIDALIAIDPTEPISVFMRVALLTGFSIALPYIALEIWLFIAPGLHKSSRHFSLAALPFAILFFIGGMAFAYFIILPNGLPFLINFMGMRTELRPSSYIRFVTAIMFWMGIAFQFPLIIYIIARIGLINASSLAKQWRLAIVIIAIVAALITPTIDPVNMALVMGPLILLFFFSIFLAKIAERGRK
jgi:sec-independent protein translocase protein TatC